MLLKISSLQKKNSTDFVSITPAGITYYYAFAPEGYSS